MAQEYSSFKRIGLVLGIILVIVGILALIYSTTFWGPGGTGMGEEGWFEEETNRSGQLFGFMAVGMFLIFFGVALIYFTNIRKVYKYVATETAPAVEITGGAVGRGVASGIRDAGGIHLSHSGGHGHGHSHGHGPREVIKVKCRRCGYLETEDADFCSKCGKKI
jgi:hypothetical protein